MTLAVSGLTKRDALAVPNPVLCIITLLIKVVEAIPTPPAVAVTPTVKIPTVLIPVTEVIFNNCVFWSAMISFLV